MKNIKIETSIYIYDSFLESISSDHIELYPSVTLWSNYFVVAVNHLNIVQN
jgi:hypothetical protein